MNKKDLAKAGVQLAKIKQSGSDYGTEYLDRTIYHTVELTDVDGKILIDGNGEPIIRNQVLYLASVWISPKELEHALSIEQEFKDLNDMFRNKMSAEGVQWKIPRLDQTVLRISGMNGN